MRLVAPTYVLVGNHDYISNQQFLSENHWMTAMKEWNNTVIVDKVVTLQINTEKFVFVPYVSPGRFQEALGTSPESWKDADCIFAHQEFAGCKMGAIISVEGDKWPIDYPRVISGHIHSKQKPQENIYYTGSALQHAFGESDKNIIAYLSFNRGEMDVEEINLELPRKKIVYMDVEDIEKYAAPETDDQIKVTVNGNYEEFKALKKTKKYKNLIDKGLKVVFKPKKEKKNISSEEKIVTKETESSTDFTNILNSIVNNEKNPYLLQNYELVVNGKEISLDDIMFL